MKTEKSLWLQQVSNAEYELIKKWQLSGRTAFLYPRRKKISLSGINYDYNTALAKIRDFFNPHP